MYGLAATMAVRWMELFWRMEEALYLAAEADDADVWPLREESQEGDEATSFKRAA